MLGRRYITAAQLKRYDACRSQIDKFEALFGKGGSVRITKQTAEMLVPTFSISWAVLFLLTDKQYRKFQRILPTALKRFNATENWFASACAKVKELTANRSIPMPYREYCEVQQSMARTELLAFYYARAEAFAIAYNSPKR